MTLNLPGAHLGLSVTASEMGPRILSVSLSRLPLRTTHGDGYERLNKHFEKQ
ncbi:F-box only protein 23, isoform CRA_b, partial [Rattus norvegicus]